MIKRAVTYLFMGLLLLNTSGCFLLLAGAAGGAGTAVWLSGKLSQEFHASYERTVDATEKALKSLDLKIAKVSREDTVTQFRSEYNDGKEIWIDVRRITDTSSKVEIRVGAVSPDKAAADKILKRIQKYL